MRAVSAIAELLVLLCVSNQNVVDRAGFPIFDGDFWHHLFISRVRVISVVTRYALSIAGDHGLTMVDVQTGAR